MNSTKEKQPLTLLMLAAGMGSRYGGLKQLDAMGPHGETLMDYSLYDARRAGFTRLVFIIRRDMEEAFEERISSRLRPFFEVTHVYQELDDLPAGVKPPATRTKPWGTGQAVLVAEKAIQGPFVALNADDFYGPSSYRLLADHLRTPTGPIPEYGMVGFQLRPTLSEHGSVARGVCRCNEEGYLVSIEELTRIEKKGDGAIHTQPDGSVQHLTGDEVVSMNIWGFTTAAFQHLREEFETFLRDRREDPKAEFYIPSMVNQVIQDGRARCRVHPGTDTWFGVTYRDDKPLVMAQLREHISNGVYPEKLWS